jgi:hypothetical protein
VNFQATLTRYQLTQKDIYQKNKNMGSPFRQRSAFKHNVLDTNSKPWDHEHLNGRVRGKQNVQSDVVADPKYLENQNFANRNVFDENGNKINAADQQFDQATQIANMYNSGRLNPEGFNTKASYRDKQKLDGKLKIKNGKVDFKFPGSEKILGDWTQNTNNINFNDGEDGSLIAPSTQYTPDQINEILGQTGLASFVPDGNGGFAFESGGGNNTFEEEINYRGDYRDDQSMPEGFSTILSPEEEKMQQIIAARQARYNQNPLPESEDNKNLSLEERRAILEAKKAKILAARASNATQRVGRAINISNRYK